MEVCNSLLGGEKCRLDFAIMAPLQIFNRLNGQTRHWGATLASLKVNKMLDLTAAAAAMTVFDHVIPSSSSSLVNYDRLEVFVAAYWTTVEPCVRHRANGSVFVFTRYPTNFSVFYVFKFTYFKPTKTQQFLVKIISTLIKTLWIMKLWILYSIFAIFYFFISVKLY